MQLTLDNQEEVTKTVQNKYVKLEEHESTLLFYKSISDFSSPTDYIAYLILVLESGMKVKLTQNCWSGSGPKVSEIGYFRNFHNLGWYGLFYWEDLGQDWLVALDSISIVRKSDELFKKDYLIKAKHMDSLRTVLQQSPILETVFVHESNHTRNLNPIIVFFHQGKTVFGTTLENFLLRL